MASIRDRSSERGGPVPEINEVGGCLLLRVRRLARRAAAIYDRQLEPAKLTISQFGLMAQIHGLSRARPPGPTLGTVAERFGMDPTTLNRSVKPLVAAGWIAIAVDLEDRRARILSVTAAGRAKLGEALPLWRAAEAEVERALGVETTLAMKGLLDLATARLTP